MFRHLAFVAALSLSPLTPSVPAWAQTPADSAAALGMADRPEDQRARDATRQAEVDFALSHVKPGQRVLDMGAGQGYMSWLFSAAVGPEGRVDVQNPQGWVDYYKMAPALEAMQAKRANIKAVIAPFTAVPAPDQPYDLIYSSMVYHDTYNEDGADALNMNATLFQHVKPGGLYIVVDHNAPTGTGTRDTKTTHRIDKQVVINDLTRAGFKLLEDNDLLSNPADARDLNVFDPAIRGKTDRFVLVFQKP